MIACMSTLQAQYLPFSVPAFSGNPNGFHRGDDIQNPMPGQGWTVIYNAADSLPKWTSPITIPFPFWFDNVLKSSLRVSNTGIVMFDTALIDIPKDTTVILPKKGFPPASVYMLGLSSKQHQGSIIFNPSARMPMIRTRMFGFAPNRQFWISFTGFSYMHESSNHLSLCNWSIMLEEASNFIYVIDHSTFSFERTQNGIRLDTMNIGLSIGIQIHDSNGVMLGSRIGSKVLNPRIGLQYDYAAEDNAYHVFKPKDAIPTIDASVSKIIIGELTAGSIAGMNIPAMVMNNGSDTIRTFRLRLREDDSIIRDTVIEQVLSPGKSSQVFSALWNPSKSKRYRLAMWCDSINGGKADEYGINDTATALTAYMVNPPKKSMLIEQFTSTTCGDCPRGITAIDSAMNGRSDVLHIAYHLGNDPMALKRADTLLSAYEGTIGSMMIDRTLFPNLSGSTMVNLPRNSAFVQGAPIVEALDLQSKIPTPAGLSISAMFHNPTRMLTATISSRFEAEISGDIRVNAVLIQDSVQGGDAFNQANSMSGDATIPIWGNAPQTLTGFVHRNVANNILGDESAIFGISDSIAYDTRIGTVYSCTFRKELPNTIDVKQASLIGFVYDYNPDLLFGKIINSAGMSLQYSIVAIEETQKRTGLSVFPQPATDIAMIHCSLPIGQATIEVRSLLGSLVYTHEFMNATNGDIVHQLDCSRFPSGQYIINVKQATFSESHQLSVIR